MKLFLVPFFDLINHAESASVQYLYQRREQNFELTMKQEIKKGDQIFINYGTYGSFDKLLDYAGVQIRNANSQFCEFVRSESEFASH